MKKYVLSTLAATALACCSLGAPAMATEVTVSCVGPDRHMQTTVEPHYGPGGKVLSTFDPVVISAQCVSEKGDDVVILQMDSHKLQFETVAEAKAFLEFIVRNAKRLVDGDSTS